MAISEDVRNTLNKLRVKVERIINGTDTLFVDDSFVVAVADFMKKKETYITKVSLPNGDYELRYDLDKGRTILRDLLFLQFYVVSKMSDDNGLQPAFKAALENHQKTFDNVSGTTVNTCLISGSGVSQLENKHAIAVIDDPFILNVLRDSIVIIDMIRNSFGHNENAQKCYYIENNRLIKLSNDGGFANPNDALQSIKNYLDLEIPYEYIAQFGEGIEARDTDLYYMELADLNAFLISSSLKYDDDVFKRTSVERLDFLYNYVGNDNALIQELPKIVFSSSVPLSKINYLFDRCDIHDLKKLPVGIYSSRCTLDRIVKLHNLGKSRADYYADGYSLDKIDVDLMASLPNLLFTCSDKNLDIIMNLTDLSLYGEDKLLKISDISSLPRFISYSGISKERVDYLLSASKNIDEFIKIPAKVFSTHFSQKNLSILIGNPPDVTRLYDLPVHVFIAECSPEKLEFLMGPDRDIDNLKIVSKELFTNRFSVETLSMLLNGDDVKKLRDIDFSRIRDNSDIRSLSRIWGAVPNVNILKNFPSNLFDNRVPLELVNLLVLFVNKSSLYNEFVQLVCFPTFSFDNLRYIVNLDEGISDFDLLDYIFSNDELVRTLISIPKFAFSKFCTKSRLEILLGEERDCKRLKNLPATFFSPTIKDDKIRFLISSQYAFDFFSEPRNFELSQKIVYVAEERLTLLCGDNLIYRHLLELPDYIIFNTYSNKKLEFLLEKSGIFLLKFVPFACFSENVSIRKIEYLYNSVNDFTEFCNLSYCLFEPRCTIDRIHYLLGKCDNDIKKVNQLPKDLFFCDDEMVDSLFTVSSKNMKIKNDLYSHLDEKNKALLIYANGVFSLMDKSLIDYSLLDFSSLDFSTRDRLFKGVTHKDVQTNMKSIESLCSSHDKMLKAIDDNRLSFTRRYSMNNILSMSSSDLVNNFKQWESDFKSFFDQWLLKKLIDSSKRTTDNLRNSADHLRFMQLTSGELGIFDEETKKTSDGKEKRTVSFAARTKTKSLFKSISLIHNQVVDNDYTKFNNCDACLAHYMKASGIEEDYYILKSRLSSWIEQYIESTRRMCVSLYYLKNQVTVSNATAVYSGASGINLKYNESGANVTYSVDTWYTTLTQDVLDNDISTIDNIFRR